MSEAGADAAADLEAVHVRQHHVQQHGLEAAAAEEGQAALARGGHRHLEAVDARYSATIAARRWSSSIMRMRSAIAAMVARRPVAAQTSRRAQGRALRPRDRARGPAPSVRRACCRWTRSRSAWRCSGVRTSDTSASAAPAAWRPRRPARSRPCGSPPGAARSTLAPPSWAAKASRFPRCRSFSLNRSSTAPPDDLVDALLLLLAGVDVAQRPLGGDAGVLLDRLGVGGGAAMAPVPAEGAVQPAAVLDARR